MSADTPVILVPRGDDPLRHLATRLLAQYQQQLPDLSRAVVLLPHTGAVQRFRQLLLDQAVPQGYSALRPPYTGTPTSWAGQFTDANKRLLSGTARELLILELLEDYPQWRREYGDWPLADSLLALFDELTLHNAEVPTDPHELLRQLVRRGADLDEVSPFSDEAQMVQALWGAWRARLNDKLLEDQTRRYTQGLQRSLENLPSGTRIYLAGFADFTINETDWIKALLNRECLTLVLQGSNTNEPDDAVTRLLHAVHATTSVIDSRDEYAGFLDRVFSTGDGNLRQRALKQSATNPVSPARGRLVLHLAADAESEARAIDVQVRRWLALGQRDIGIVTNDRKLARRVRALLERANIGLQDAGGWALSTTSAATALARWLECVERDFPHSALLDLLKSPFLQPEISGPGLDRLVPVFEQDVVRANNITSGIDQYRFGIERVSGQKQDEFVNIHESLTQLLDRLRDAAAELISLLQARVRPAEEFLTALRISLEKAGLSRGFAADAAGQELLAVLQEMLSAAQQSSLRVSWSGFHQWLRRRMEQQRFHPPMSGRGVELMSFAESRLYRFDALIIAGAVREHLPGAISAPPYFNDSVRTELGLPSLARRYAALFEDFRRLLEAAPRVMVSLRREAEGERLAPSPWIERLHAFHELAYRDSLNDPELDWLVQQADTVIVNREAPLPLPVPPPAAHLPASLLPAAFTATDYQRLMNCPYQFFSARGLGLSPEDEIREEMEKKDYGTHVHRILQAFHSGVRGLPGPWRGTLDDSTRSEAETLLREMSGKVFARDLRRRFVSRGWLHRWEKCIPAYLDWEITRAATWRVEDTEIRKDRSYKDGDTHITLTGRIDRLDRGQDGLGIIDYKTGAVPTNEQVQTGEYIQLPFYGLLLEEEKISQAAFLMLDDEEVRERVILSGESFALLRTAVRERLMLLKRRLDAGAAMPAWGDRETCRLCEMEGLCRREMWAEPLPSVP
ncbi:MAG: PD-(D/E)XK nuclease family protein [Sulfuricaulis sp.]|nr:PD-(D/E)XK nuclease family protein [Sulfuricaulis sp.]